MDTNFTKDKIFLIEYFDDNDSGSVTEMVVDEEDKKVYKEQGLRVNRIVDTLYNVVTSYDAKTDCTDLKFFKKFNDNPFYFVSVMVDKYDNYFWMFMKLKNVDVEIEKGVDHLFVDEYRKCTDEEVTYINSLFPMYYDEIRELS